MTVETTIGPIVYGLAAATAPGEQVCGDRAAVVGTSGGGTLVAVADGLGHGPDAESAAARAVATVGQHADVPLVDLMRRCHQELRPTRGAALSVAAVDVDGRFEWLAVGNVAGIVLRADTGSGTRLISRGGVVGMRLPVLRATSLRLEDGDRLLMFTDGIADTAASRPLTPGRLQVLAELLLERHRHGRDDALVFVGRFVGGRP